MDWSKSPYCLINFYLFCRQTGQIIVTASCYLFMHELFFLYSIKEYNMSSYSSFRSGKFAGNIYLQFILWHYFKTTLNRLNRYTHSKPTKKCFIRLKFSPWYHMMWIQAVRKSGVLGYTFRYFFMCIGLKRNIFFVKIQVIL